MSDSTHARLRALEDREAIRETLHAYGRAIDDGDEAAFADCWLSDAVLRWPGREPLVGREAILGAFRAHTHGPEVRHRHLVLHPKIDQEPEHAHIESWYIRLDGAASGPRVSSFGRYLDVMVRCSDGRWRFAQRRAVQDAHAEHPPQPSRP